MFWILLLASPWVFVLGFLAMSFIWLLPKSRIPYALTIGAVSVGTALLIGALLALG